MNNRRTRNRVIKPVVPRTTNDETPQASEPVGGGPKLDLSRLDWAALACVAAALLVAPMWAAGFATPAQPILFTRDLLTLEGPLSLTAEIWGRSITLLLIAAAVLILGYRELKRPVAIGAVPGLVGAFTAAALWASLSLAAGHVPYLSLNALSFLFGALLLGGVVSRLGRSRHGIGALAITIALAGSVIAGIGVREYLEALREGVSNHRTFSTFGPDFLAGYLLLTLPLTAAAFASASRSTLRLPLGFGLTLQSGCLFLTGSRAGTAIAVLSLALWTGLSLFTGGERGRRRWVGAAWGVFALASIISAAPTVARFDRPGAHAAGLQPATSSAGEGAQAHSAEFRKRTWIGTARMATRNPVLGAGIGAYSVTYPRYADTAFTGHAHNSFLQWTAETGFPGALALVTALAAASAFAAHILLLARAGRNLPEREAADADPAWLQSPRLLLAGLGASLIASTLHNLFDSDLYIVATLVTFAAVFGLLIAQARAIAPLATQTPRTIGKELWTLAAVACVFLLLRAGQVGLSRWDRSQALPPAPGGEISPDSVAAARAASAADPFDPEPLLALAQFASSPNARVESLRSAVRVAPTGMDYYLLGRSLAEQAMAVPEAAARAKLLLNALDALERARDSDPHNLQNLRVLAETQRAAGRTDEARVTYQAMAELESAPYGAVRAMPELKEAEFAYGYAGLGDLALDSRHYDEAERDYAQAMRVLADYWPTRNWLVNLARTPAKRRALGALYLHVLEGRRAALVSLGRKSEAESVRQTMDTIERDLAADAQKPENAGG